MANHDPLGGGRPDRSLPLSQPYAWSSNRESKEPRIENGVGGCPANVVYPAPRICDIFFDSMRRPCCKSTMPAVQPARYCGPDIMQPQQTDVKLERQKSELLGILAAKSVRHGTFRLSSGAVSDLYVDA